MKKNYILLIVFTGLIFSGCENYLDKSPDLGLDTEKIYSDYYDYRALVDNAHYHVVNQLRFREQGTNHMIGIISDEAQYRYGSQARMFNSGNWLNQNSNWEVGFTWNPNSTSYYGSVMGGAFPGLRIANLAIANIDKLKTFPPETGYTPAELRGHLLGQAYFLRSHFYFQIIHRMGGMPIFDRPYSSDEDLDLERLSYRESTTWLVAGYDSAAKYLPAVWETKDQPRPTKSSALALKAMALLYDASPLMNPDKGYTYDIERCKDAARASVDALNAAASSGFHIMYPWNEWFDNFYSQNTYVSREAIYLPPMGGRPNWTTYNRNGLGWMMAPWDGGWTAWSFPTQNAVDWFETADGYAIEDAPPTSYDPQNPHVNRDPRLKATIWVEGDNMYVGAVPDPIPAELQTWPGGYHWNNAQTTTPQWTGYVFKKWMPAGHNKYDKAPGWWYKMMPYMRYAQLYLDFAEAANEAYGPNGAVPGTSLTAVSAVNIVRNRANMPDVLAIYTGSKEAFRERIRNERAVELMQEYNRLADLRRWYIAKEKLAHIYQTDNIKSGDVVVYGVKEFPDARVFEDRNYWYPFPTSIENMFSKFKQNPGW